VQKSEQLPIAAVILRGLAITGHLASVTLVKENDGWHQFLSNFNSVLTHLKRKYISIQFDCYRSLTFKAEVGLFKRPMYPLNYKRNGIKHTFVAGQCGNNGVFTPNGSQRKAWKKSQTTDLFKNSTPVETLNNQKQIQTKRLADIDLEEWEKSKQRHTILRTKNNGFGKVSRTNRLNFTQSIMDGPFIPPWFQRQLYNESY